MKRLGTVILVLAGFIGGIAFVYSCGGGSSSQSGNLTWPSPVAATGQITSYAGSDDGALQTGVAWPDPRFTDNVDGTVTDNLTGLVWLKNANCFVQTNWTSAIIDANQLASGSCSLSDGSAAGDWRLPNVNEFLSLVDYGSNNPALPNGHPFIDVQIDGYNTSTTMDGVISHAWLVYFSYGNTLWAAKTDTLSVWPVRDQT